MRHITPLFILAMTACDDPIWNAGAEPCPPAFVEDEAGDCVFDEPSVAEIMRTFADGELVQINAEAFGQVTSPDVLRNVFITVLPVEGRVDTVDLYTQVDPDRSDEELTHEFPVGTVIVHERVDGLEGSTVQIKREAGWVGEGDRQWWFGKYFPDGEPDEADCSPCIACHTDSLHPGTEGLFGVPHEAL